MTEEQVKQVVADMISSGELEVKVGINTLPTFSSGAKRKSLIVAINHNKENGYSKSLYKKSIEFI